MCNGVAASACRHCGSTQRLLAMDDGVVVCRVCVLAWGGYARLASGPTIPEPGRREFDHLEHRSPRLGCPLCARVSWSGFRGYYERRP